MPAEDNGAVPIGAEDVRSCRCAEAKGTGQEAPSATRLSAPSLRGTQFPHPHMGVGQRQLQASSQSRSSAGFTEIQDQPTLPAPSPSGRSAPHLPVCSWSLVLSREKTNAYSPLRESAWTLGAGERSTKHTHRPQTYPHLNMQT